MAAAPTRTSSPRSSGLRRVATRLLAAEHAAEEALKLAVLSEVVAETNSREVEDVLRRVDQVLAKLEGLRTRLMARLPALALTGTAPESDISAGLSEQTAQQDVVFRAVYVDLDVDNAIAAHSAQTGVSRAEVFRSLLEAVIQFDRRGGRLNCLRRGASVPYSTPKYVISRDARVTGM